MTKMEIDPFANEPPAPRPSPVTEHDFYGMSEVELLSHCGDKAERWAEAFCQIKSRQGWSAADIDKGLMLCWFANAIEHSNQVRDEAAARCSAVNEQAIVFWYKNYKGEEGYRRAIPISIRYGTSDYHHSPQWLMLAFDTEKQSEREFAMSDMSHNVLGERIVLRFGGVAQPAPKSEAVLAAADELHDLGFQAGWMGAIEECAKIAASYDQPGRFKVSDTWKDDLTPAAVYEIAMIDASNWIAKDIRALALSSTDGASK